MKWKREDLSRETEREKSRGGGGGARKRQAQTEKDRKTEYVLYEYVGRGERHEKERGKEGLSGGKEVLPPTVRVPYCYLLQYVASSIDGESLLSFPPSREEDFSYHPLLTHSLVITCAAVELNAKCTRIHA